MLPPTLFKHMYHGAPESRLDFARSLHTAMAAELTRDKSFTAAFAELRDAAGLLAGYMAGLGMGDLCAACSAGDHGGCCSRDMAEETDALQMLMNMLAGVKIAVTDQGRACCFLGSLGCTFLFKPMFCLNYNCERIVARLGPARIELEALSGQLLGRQYTVEKALIEKIKALGAFSSK